ncbi:hypothetical protein [Streptomyces sp. UNOB3_S3]|uniref:hypothetical protein n=1 Tax=Streptomyces sp. UNOB3_S3 TaxID=2871682 RepID=UPI001E2968D9|nr:hypothetical protein [Streptomyces sp. UNOB3_S3]MCC3775572.1 hypothetical protein [Streptomyces sp. UNOB3_S3]
MRAVRSVRPFHATPRATALAAGLLGVLLCGCSEPGGLQDAGPAQPPTALTGPVYAVEGPGKPSLRRPASFEAGESVRLTGLRWLSWGGPAAEATGEASGGWCLPACRARSYPAKVTFAGLVRKDRSAYYGRAVVVVDGLPPGQHNELRDLRLYVPPQASR